MTDPISLNERETEAVNAQVTTLVENYGWRNVVNAMYIEFCKVANMPECSLTRDARDAICRTMDDLLAYGSLLDKLDQ